MTLPLQVSLIFFGADSNEPDHYRLLLEATRFADANGFTAVWLPERHFMRFGGLYGTPSVLGAAVAVSTRRLGIRAGSVVFPLNHPLRIAEEWSILDNLSNGRVALAVATGWHVNDFVLAPDAYARRREIAYERLEIVRRLWRGERVEFPNGEGATTSVAILPRPVQPELPIWITMANASQEGFRAAGERGHNVLSANFAHSYRADHLEGCVAAYREAIQRAHGRRGHVTLLVHAYAARDERDLDATATPAMLEYLRVNFQMQVVRGAQQEGKYQQLDEKKKEMLLVVTAKANMRSALSFVGTKDELRTKAAALQACGVDELACLSDFGVPFDENMASHSRMAELLA